MFQSKYNEEIRVVDKINAKAQPEWKKNITFQIWIVIANMEVNDTQFKKKGAFPVGIYPLYVAFDIVMTDGGHKKWYL